MTPEDGSVPTLIDTTTNVIDVTTDVDAPSADVEAPDTSAAEEEPERPDYPTFAAGHEQALIGDAIARSHAEGRWVAVQR